MLDKILNFLKLRLIETGGLIVFTLSIFYLYSIVNYSPENPTILTPSGPDEFFLKSYSYYLADFLLQAFGLLFLPLVADPEDFDWDFLFFAILDDQIYSPCARKQKWIPMPIQHKKLILDFSTSQFYYKIFIEIFITRLIIVSVERSTLAVGTEGKSSFPLLKYQAVWIYINIIYNHKK